MRNLYSALMVALLCLGAYWFGRAQGVNDVDADKVYIRNYCAGWKDGNSAVNPEQFKIDSLELEQKVHRVWR